MTLTDEYTKHSTTLVLTLGAAALAVAALYAEPVLNSSADTLATRRVLVSAGNVFNLVLSGLAAVGSFVAVVAGAALMGAEFRWGTARHQAVLRTTRRWLGAKLAFGLTVPPLMVAVGLAVGAVSSRVTGAMIGTPPSADHVALDPLQLASQALTTLAGLELWLVVSMAATLVLRSSAGGALATIAYVYVESMLAPVVAPALARFLPASAQVATLQVFRYLPDAGLVGRPQVLLPGVTWGASMVVVGVALALAAALVLGVGPRRELPA